MDFSEIARSKYVHFEMTFLTTLTSILDFPNLIFQTGIFSQFTSTFNPTCRKVHVTIQAGDQGSISHFLGI